MQSYKVFQTGREHAQIFLTNKEKHAQINLVKRLTRRLQVHEEWVKERQFGILRELPVCR